MADIYSLKRDRNNYYDLKDKLYSIVSSYNSCIDSLNASISSLKNYYLVDGTIYDDGLLYSQIENLKERRNYIIYTIIPAIDRDIYKINREINSKQ